MEKKPDITKADEFLFSKNYGEDETVADKIVSNDKFIKQIQTAGKLFRWGTIALGGLLIFLGDITSAIQKLIRLVGG